MKGDVKVVVNGSSGHIVFDESSLIKRILLYLISAKVTVRYGDYKRIGRIKHDRHINRPQSRSRALCSCSIQA